MAGLGAAKKRANEEAGDEKLYRGRYAAATVPAAQSVAGEELATARAREPKDVLEVRKRSRECAGNSGIKRTAHCAQQKDTGDARTDLEGSVGDVLVRHAIAREVKQ